jgi:hypothetical protein
MGRESGEWMKDGGFIAFGSSQRGVKVEGQRDLAPSSIAAPPRRSGCSPALPYPPDGTIEIGRAQENLTQGADRRYIFTVLSHHNFYSKRIILSDSPVMGTAPAESHAPANCLRAGRFAPNSILRQGDASCSAK